MKIMKTQTLLVLVILTAITTACAAPDAGSPSSPSNNSSSQNTGLPFMANPPSVTVAASGQVQLGASGGVTPYSYRVTTGAGSVDFRGGLYTAPATNGTATVTISDSTGALRTVSITIGTGTVTPSPNPTPTTQAAECPEGRQPSGQSAQRNAAEQAEAATAKSVEACRCHSGTAGCTKTHRGCQARTDCSTAAGDSGC
jgi:hypothetical protein